MSKKIITGPLIIYIALQTHNIKSMGNWWARNIACYFAHGGERLHETSQRSGRYDIVIFTEEDHETNNLRIYSFVEKMRRLALIN